MLEKEFDYYLNNQSELVAKYGQTFIVIKNQEVLGSYSSEKEAYFETSKKYEPGTFLIQFCESGKGSYTQTFHSRVTFA
ncbi:hypothetical protein Pedsa_0957 [Pseudopedobacter saltans DSM 12145]|uniref:DUF5678 domain-containing protein n=1 Tax=Pseudopedobacter saltans (strain ATCC 51119 / DSM 12145 / JCM 21818 / CCUG 39354 / LMG 10337 / NBRC 100064 / NCIMB 13643) TaxID=762903 RepID=F0SAF2_PSESL|nr:hypothetical protein [Pseudopedobacter saltans]ADY51529.1 hypothetical protein Pedsa_0957 [Pseudopedobacter saltans DSM 12145]